MNNKLVVRDFVSIGIFSAIYIIIYMLLATLGFIPILQMAMMPIGALLCAPLYMLLIARTQKPFCISIMGLLCAVIVGILFYGNVYVALVNLAFPLIAELIAYMGRYKSFRWNTVSYAVMSLWVIGQMGTYWFARDWIYELTVSSGYSVAFADGMLRLATPLGLVIMLAATVIGSVASAFIAKSMLKKHFTRAGIA